jgi:hypothetical protein
VAHLLAVGGGRKEMPPRAEVLSHRLIGCQKALGMSWRFESLYTALPLARPLVGIFRPIVEVPVLSVFDTAQHLTFCRPVAPQFIGHDHPRDVRQPLKEFAEEFFGSSLVTPTLHQDIEYVLVLVDGAPEIVSFAIDREKHLIQVPFVTWSGVPAPKLVGVLLAKFPTPLGG